MDIGMIGLGRMGNGLVQRLLRDDHHVVVYDRDPTAVSRLVAAGARGTASVGDLVQQLTPPRAVWVMVPAGVTGSVIDDLAGHLEAGDTIVDGGNSFYQDDQERSAILAKHGLHLVDVGTSGGVFGLERGFSLMIGGDDGAVALLDPVFRSLAPGVGSAERTPGRTGTPSQSEHGYLHCGPTGAGHFVKMIHNGIEYGVMAAFSEGLNVLKHADAGLDEGEADAETAPLRRPDHYQYRLDIPEIAEVWRRGSVIASWLLDLTAAALAADPHLDGYAGHVSDSGEGRWAVLSAVEEGVPAPVLSAALYGRYDSRGRDEFANQVLSAMRKQFGGHDEETEPA